MDYQRTAEGLEPHLPNILVYDNGGVIEAYYHYQPLVFLADVEFVTRTKVFPKIVGELLAFRTEHYRVHDHKYLAVCMQGAGHREPFREIIRYLQVQYDELWCWTSIRSEGRTLSYKNLGFSFNPRVEYTFPNPYKGGEESTYQLGIWEKGNEPSKE